MSLLKKSTPAAEAFRVPSLVDADDEYAAMATRLANLTERQVETKREILELEKDLDARPSPAIRSGVAELLGDTVDTSLHGRPAKLRDLRTRFADLEAAVAIIRRRMADRRGPASVAVCKLVRAEYGRRVAAIISALEQVAAARELADQLLDDLEREEVQFGYLPPLRPTFLGDRYDGHIPRFLRDAKEARYV